MSATCYRASQFLLSTLKEPPAEAVAASHQLLVRGGFIRQLAAGLYSMLPLGVRSLRKLERILRQEMQSVGAQEFRLPSLHPAEPWRSSGRWDEVDETMFRLRDRRGGEYCLAMTHEEIFTALASTELRSYRQLPQRWFQIGLKFRDEPRPKAGLLRVREFHMKDAYSFDLDAAGLDRAFDEMKAAYVRIFGRCGIATLAAEASSGSMGGDESIEFMVATPAGEDKVLRCAACGYVANVEVGRARCPSCGGAFESFSALEVGHIFKLGTRYSAAMNALVLNASGERVPVVMGCYGIGLERLLAAVVELHHDARGIIWPMAIAPFSATVLTLGSEPALCALAERVVSDLVTAGVDTLYDDRDERAGVKLNDADLIGIPLRITVGRSGIREQTVEWKLRASASVEHVPVSEVAAPAAALHPAPVE